HADARPAVPAERCLAERRLQPADAAGVLPRRRHESTAASRNHNAEGGTATAVGCLRLAQDEVQTPATTDVGPRITEMREHLGVRTAGVFEGVGQHGEALRVQLPRRQNALVVGSLRELQDGVGEPRGVERDGSEGVAYYLPEQVTLSRFLSLLGSEILLPLSYFQGESQRSVVSSGASRDAVRRCCRGAPSGERGDSRSVDVERGRLLRLR